MIDMDDFGALNLVYKDLPGSRLELEQSSSVQDKSNAQGIGCQELLSSLLRVVPIQCNICFS